MALIRHSNRPDLPIKLAYARKRLSGQECDWERHAYLENIRAFNNFFEIEPRKESPEEFLSSFDELIFSIKANGYPSNYPPVEVNNAGQLMGGAHRAAVSGALGLKIPAIKSDGILKWDYKFFRLRHQPEYISDFATLERIRIDDSARLFVVYGGVSSSLDDDFCTLLQSKGSVLYKKELKLSLAGLVTLKRLLYKSEEHRAWLGTRNTNFQGARRHARNSAGRWPVRVYVSAGISDEDARKTKSNLREVSGLGNYAVHSTDSHKETLEVAEMMLNPNLALLLKNLSRDWETFSDLYTEMGVTDPMERGRALIVGSAIMNVFGIRKSQDVDYLTCTTNPEVEIPEGWDNHSDQMEFYSKSSCWLASDPRCHFSVGGAKFLAPSELLSFKLNRREFPKDWTDAFSLAILALPVSTSRAMGRIAFFLQQYLNFATWRQIIRATIDWVYVRVLK